jgi:hypothetical protein
MCQSTSSPSKVAAFWRQISRSPTIHGPLSMNRLGLSTIPILPRWFLNDLPSSCLSGRCWLGRRQSAYIPWRKWDYRLNRVSKAYLPISLPSQPPCQLFNSPILDKGRKSEGQTGACHSMPFSTAARSLLLTPHVLQPPTCLLDFIYQRVSPWSNLPSL